MSGHPRIMALSVHRNPEWPKVKLWAQESAPGRNGKRLDAVYHVWIGPLLFQWTPRDIRRRIAGHCSPLPPQ